MMGLVIAIHAIVCVLLIGIILVQAGRGGGLVEGFSGVESMFGTKTNSFLTRTTTALSILFFLTCVGLAFLSVRQSRSLMKDTKPGAASGQALPAQEESKQNAVEQKNTEEAPKAE